MMTFDLVVKRSASNAAKFEVSVVPREIRAGSSAEIRAVTVDEVAHTARALLTGTFRDGDSIIYGDIIRTTIEVAVRAVEMTRNTWT